MPVVLARLKAIRLGTARAGYSCGLAALLLLFGARGLQNAVAEGDTRTITMHHIHTDEDITITFKRDGQYDEAALEKLNWFLRDWRKAEATKMDPHLIDLVWEVQREAGNKAPIWVVCGYRSPQTNAMLRHRSSGVARFSQHMLGHAMDFYIPGVPLAQLREIGLRLARGGVGFYPTSGSPFLHMDTGSIRMWPRMSHEELARVFPDGRTVQIPTDGKPLSGYALALADIRQRGNNPSENSLATAQSAGVNVGPMVASNVSKNPFAKLLGLKTDDDEEEADAAPAPSTSGPATKAKAMVVAAAEHVKATATRVAEQVEAKVKLVHVPVPTASAPTAAPPVPAPAPVRLASADAQFAALSANQVILSRGYWEGLPDSSAAQSLKTAFRPHNTEVASADPSATGTIVPLSNASADRAAPELALGYAAADTPSRAVALAASATREAATALLGQSETTVVVKGVNDRPKTTVQKAFQLAAAAVKVSERLDSPWLRAVILSPSVHRFLSTLALGARDFTSLAGLMVKPASSVMMTFSSDPNLGLAPDHFSGSAVVFLSTISYPTPTHTASLQ